ncbi:zinc-ribbon domain-containing protein [SAR202 cluster bacterium AC-647-N09_OGT_505m]|nr:zinc-ribbon domain-containing protein [SAR202 cluster bacterium AC-647-N09_OGT_505m]
MKTCGKCGLISGDFANFCQDCGSPLSMECPNCGTELSTNAGFCFQCGTSQTIVVFPDKNLEAAVRKVLEKPEGISGSWTN